MSRRGRARQTKRDYPRSARLSQLLREIVAEEVTELDDDRLELVSITAVDVDDELHRAIVFFDSLDGDLDEVTTALTQHRVRLQGAIGSQAHVRRVPELLFRPDPAITTGQRVDEILRDLDAADVDEPGEAGVPDEGP